MNDKTKTAAPAPAPATAAAAAPTPRLGETISVKPAPGVELINNETGLQFKADEATPVTVTVTTLRRLADGDLIAV